MLLYVTDLRAITQGCGVFTMKYIRHEVALGQIAQTIIANSKNGKVVEEEDRDIEERIPNFTKATGILCRLSLL